MERERERLLHCGAMDQIFQSSLLLEVRLLILSWVLGGTSQWLNDIEVSNWFWRLY